MSVTVEVDPKQIANLVKLLGDEKEAWAGSLSLANLGMRSEERCAMIVTAGAVTRTSLYKWLAISADLVLVSVG